MNFSVVLIARNEEKTLPRLLDSLKEFQDKGGEVVLCDTGSTDKTAEYARSRGVKVTEVGTRFLRVITKEQAEAINARFCDGEEDVVKEGDKLFDYASARNFAATLSSKDVIATPDCDEAYTKLDLEKINKVITDGAEQLEYNFVFSHDKFGNEAVKFLHCKFYDRRKLKWVGVIHEVLTGSAKRIFLDESIIKLEHWQNHETNRSGYLKGLAIDCFDNPDNDRNSHYFGRELVWTGRPKSGIRELKRHLSMDRWPTERSQSMLFIGDAYLMLGDEAEALAWFNKALALEPYRREPLMRLAELYWRKNQPQYVAVYAMAALQIVGNNFYANDQSLYTFRPHELLAWSLWYLGRKEEARQHHDKARSYKPTDSRLLSEIPFHYQLPRVSFLLPTLGREDGLNKCLESIDKLNYPKEKIEVLIDPRPNPTVPEKIEYLRRQASGDVFVFAANDVEFEPDSLVQAVLADKGLVAFNTGSVGFDNGNICEHFLIKRSLADKLGMIFDTDLTHAGVDNLLWAKAERLGEAIRCELAVARHHHFARGESEYDEVYQRGYKNVDNDRKLLKEKLTKLDKNLTVIIPVLDKVEMTGKTIDSLLATTPNIGQLIIIDDGSKEDFQPLIHTLKGKGVPVEYYVNSSEYRGVVQSWNKGMALAKFPFVAILNNDLLFSPNWFPPLLDALNDDCWMACPYHTVGEEAPEDFPVGKDRKRNMEGTKGGGIDFIGSCFVLRKDTWEKIGPIDDRLKIWCGDNFLFHMVQDGYGRKCREVKESYVHHLCSQTVRQNWDQISPRLRKDTDLFEEIYTDKGWRKRMGYPPIHRMIDLRSQLPVKDLPRLSVLNIGAGSGDSGLACQLPFLPFRKLTHIDSHLPYLDSAKKRDWLSKEVAYIHQDIKDFDNFKDYDYVLAFDVLEHLKKEDSLEVIRKITASGAKLLVFIPLEKEFRPNVYGAESQDHLSLWNEQDFIKLGFNTITLKNFHREGGKTFDALWAKSF